MRDSVAFEDELRGALDDAASTITPASVHADGLAHDISARRQRRSRSAAGASVVGTLGAVLLVVGLVARGGGQPVQLVTASAAGSAPAPQVTTAPVPAPVARLTDPNVVAAGPGFAVWGGSAANASHSDTSPPDVLHGVDAAGHGSGAVLDPATGAWSDLPPAPIVARTGAATGATQNGFAILGGSRDLQHHELLDDGAEYSFAARAWTVVPSLPEARTDASLVAVGDTLAVGGGRSATTTAPANVLLMSNGAWRTVSTSFGVYGVVADGSDIVAYGFAPDDVATMQFALIDPVANVARKLPSLSAPWQFENGQILWEYGVASAGSTITTALGNDGAVDIFQLAKSGTAWQNAGSFDTGQTVLPGNRMGASAGALLVSGTDVWAPSTRGLYRFDLATGNGHQDLKVGSRCADATRQALNERAMLVFVDASCPEGSEADVASFTSAP